MLTQQQKRPVFLNLFQIKLPVAGVMSIAHRIAGVLMFLSFPLWLYLLDLSLSSASGYQRAVELLHSLWLLPVIAVLLWAVLHHLLAGVRYLLLDIDLGIEKPHFQQSALAVLVAAPVLTLLILLFWKVL